MCFRKMHITVNQNLIISNDQCTSLQNLGSMSTKKECAGQEAQCQLYCMNGNGVCLSLGGAYIDGTVCGYDGKCKAGTCQAGSISKD